MLELCVLGGEQDGQLSPHQTEREARKIWDDWSECKNSVFQTERLGKLAIKQPVPILPQVR